MDNIYRLAKLFKERENNEWMGLQIGTVVSLDPLSIQIGKKMLLQSRHLYVAESLLPHVRKMRYQTYNGERTADVDLLAGYLQVGNQVALIPTVDEQQFLVIDKVVKQ